MGIFFLCFVHLLIAGPEQGSEDRPKIPSVLFFSRDPLHLARGETPPQSFLGHSAKTAGTSALSVTRFPELPSEKPGRRHLPIPLSLCLLGTLSGYQISPRRRRGMAPRARSSSICCRRLSFSLSPSAFCLCHLI